MAETSWRHSPVSLHVPGMFADVSATFPVHSFAWGTGLRGDISKWLESVGWLSRTSGSTAPPPFFAKVLPKITHMENYENKLNKIGLLQNPIGIGTNLGRTSM